MSKLREKIMKGDKNLKVPIVVSIIMHFILFHNKIFIFSGARKITLKLRIQDERKFASFLPAWYRIKNLFTLEENEEGKEKHFKKVSQEFYGRSEKRTCSCHPGTRGWIFNGKVYLLRPFDALINRKKECLSK